MSAANIDEWTDEQSALSDERDRQAASVGAMYDDLEDRITGPAPVEGFTVDSLERADWAVRKIARSRRRLAEAKELAAAERKRIDEWEAEQVARCQSATEYLEELLTRYHRDVLKDDPKAKTIRLPAGELVARKLPDALVCDGGVDCIAWAELNAPDTVAVRKTVDRSKMKRRLVVGSTERPEGFEAIDPSTGQVVPGFWWTQVDEVSFKVRTDVDQ